MKIAFALVLALIEGTNGLVFYCDVSRFDLGCALIQYSKVVAYASRKFKNHKKN